MKVLRTVLLWAAAAAFVGSALAQDAEKPRDGKHRRGGMGMGMELPGLRMLDRLELSDAQKASIEKIKQEYQPKLAELRKQHEGILTDEQKKARDEVFKGARTSGKKGREVFESAQAAMKLTDEQKKKLDDGRKDLETLGKEAMEKAAAVLTAEQKEKLTKMREEFQKRRAERK